MSLGRLLWERVTAAHEACGAPTVPYESFAQPLTGWTFHPLGYNGVLGIMKTPLRDGDTLVVALPTRPSHAAKLRVIALMRAHLATGRLHYTTAWKSHYVALHINHRMGGELLGHDDEGFLHFKYTAQGLERALRG
jgi:hypothetical protein